MALFPDVTEVPEGVAVSEKSAKKIVRATDAVCPLAAPLTVKFKGLAVVALRLETVTWLDPPAEIELELKLHVTPELHESTTEFGRMVLGPRAETVN